MCLAVIAIDAHPRYTTVIAANRDEFHARPTQPAQWWANAGAAPILAGRDLEHGGTWLGVTPAGRWAFVTNVREAGRHDASAPSRGILVPALLRDPRPALDALASIVDGATHYNGFNLVAGEAGVAAFGSNRGSRMLPLGRGIYGVSNAQLDTPWPKLARARAGMAAWTATGDGDLYPLWSILADRIPAPDGELPNTGIARERERLLSSPFIVSSSYGTRCSTLLALSRDGDAQFIERSFDAAGETTGEVAFRFSIEATGARGPRSAKRIA
jgi:uncharacterized protein with NRDE domain